MLRNHSVKRFRKNNAARDPFTVAVFRSNRFPDAPTGLTVGALGFPHVNRMRLCTAFRHFDVSPAKIPTNVTAADQLLVRVLRVVTRVRTTDVFNTLYNVSPVASVRSAYKQKGLGTIHIK